jgi:hypothetical protein
MTCTQIHQAGKEPDLQPFPTRIDFKLSTRHGGGSAHASTREARLKLFHAGVMQRNAQAPASGATRGLDEYLIIVGARHC